ncbi:MAG: hypothetical protein LBM01_00975 [Christensenellaceae bacterium]|jgi:hypothetical protein|nr:hypothetical protein [Christensenellaceae bacterium]
MMWEEVFNMAINYGLIPVLFVALMVWILRDTKARETKYQAMVDTLHSSLIVVADIQRAIQEIASALTGMNKDITEIKILNETRRRKKEKEKIENE